jgi:CspA family cold shock protein
MKTGVIKFYDAKKGFGFIKVDGTDEDVFVHSTGLVDRVRDNDHVTFSIEQGKKGLNAVNVKLQR